MHPQLDDKTADDMIAVLPTCALDGVGRKEQYVRYRQLAATVGHLERTADTVIVHFDGRLDRDLLEQTLAVERECCPFFAFDLDDQRWQLRITVRENDHLPALDAMVAAFSAARAAVAGGSDKSA